MKLNYLYCVLLIITSYSTDHVMIDDFSEYDRLNPVKSDYDLQSGNFYSVNENEHDKCQRIELSDCKEMPWNLTRMPNLLNQASQKLANLQLQSPEFRRLFNSNCSDSIRQLLCALSAPFCIEGRIISPCQSFCLAVADQCKFKSTLIDCSRLSNEQPCLQLNQNDIFYSMFANKPVRNNLQCSNEGHPFYSLNLADGQTLNKCGIPCSVFSTDQWLSTNPDRIRHLITALSSACLTLCVFTLLTFLIDTGRFRYPERSIIYICLCFIPISSCYLAVNALIIFKAYYPTCDQSSQLLAQGTDQLNCVVLFMFTYVPWLCSNVWFVILSFTWFLAAVLKWSHEAIGRYKVYFHTIAWISPIAIALCALAVQSITADPLSGLCMPLRSSTTIRALLTAPHMLYLVTGSAFLLIGFISLFKTRNVMKFEGRHTKKLERLMFRIGLFALLYLMPSLAVCVGNFHRQHFVAKWTTWFVCQQQELHHNIRCPFELLKLAERPQLEIALLKEVMFLCVGIVVSLWIWCPKTITTWKHFLTSKFTFSQNKNYEASV
ncbi:hypothetical protein GJ496_010156 [Pomphorhynchus laevis]|nr:hypothetical protein GJ496_010156 [Pomphorhynchus laevis]